MRIGQIYLTATLAAVPVAVAAILAATPTASPANVQLSFTAALQNVPLVEIAPPQAPCRWAVNGGVLSGCAWSPDSEGSKRLDSSAPGDGPKRPNRPNRPNTSH